MEGFHHHSSHGSPKVANLVEAIPSAAVATDRKNVVVASNARFEKLVKRPSKEFLGANLFRMLEARDIFGNLLSTEVEGVHEMARSFDSVKDFKIYITSSEGFRLFVGISIITVLSPYSDDYHLIYLMTHIQRRRRSDKFLDQILVGVGAQRNGTTEVENAGRTPDAFQLTIRQKEVLRLLTDGKTSTEISEILGLSIHTVRSHIQKILRGLEVNSQLEAVTKALTLRIL